MIYTKPIIIPLQELAEGVYASSGSPCYNVQAYITQSPQDGRGDYRIQVNGVHNAEHSNDNQQLLISFNNDVKYISSNGRLVRGNNTNTLIIEYSYHQNEYDNIGLGDICVYSDFPLAITRVQLTD